MKNNTKLLLIGSILIFTLLPNSVFAQQLSMIKNQDSSLIFQSDMDTDGDGISDSSDSCPNDPETVNGFEDLDGCPDVVPSNDTDGDGISDSSDSCPNDP
ncbi:MAG: thrombospondin type 3 repeat-containing protein, partial [Nitrosarchaeum sp.]